MAGTDINTNENIVSDDIKIKTLQQNETPQNDDLEQSYRTNLREILGRQEPALEGETLSLEYPRYAEQIKKVLRNGYDRTQLRKELMQAEFASSMQYSPNEINEFLGRTPEAMAQFIEAMQAKTSLSTKLCKA